MSKGYSTPWSSGPYGSGSEGIGHIGGTSTKGGKKSDFGGTSDFGGKGNYGGKHGFGGKRNTVGGKGKGTFKGMFCFGGDGCGSGAASTIWTHGSFESVGGFGAVAGSSSGGTTVNFAQAHNILAELPPEHHDALKVLCREQCSRAFELGNEGLVSLWEDAADLFDSAADYLAPRNP